ncbi:Flagellar biosynthesis protein FliQ [Candidatus Paraburkholderia calva]|nr:Flagellar biosynthesis protein FliQ [Candidatus Paraburkholderia calva]
MKRLTAAVSLFAIPLPSFAADMNAVNHAVQIASGVGAGSAVPSLGFGAVLQTLFGLAIVIGFVFGCAWLARRLSFQGNKRGGLVKVVGGVSLGNKERVAVVEIGDIWLVLGTAPGGVTLLHRLSVGSVEVEQAAADTQTLQGGFGKRFRDALAGETNKRFQKFGGGDK